MFFFIIFLYIGLAKTFMKSKKRFRSFEKFLARLLALFSIGLNTILMIPFYNTFLVFVFCSSPEIKDFCFQSDSILYFIGAFFGIIILSILTAIFYVFSVEYNPKSKNPIASPRSFMTLLKLSGKLTIIISFIVNFAQN